MPEATEGVIRPKSHEEQQTEYAEERTNGHISESFDSMVKSLKRLGVINDRSVKEPPYVVYSMTGQPSKVNLNDLPTLCNTSALTDKRLSPFGAKEVSIRFDSPDPANNYMEIIWKGKNENGDVEEHMAIHGSRPYNDGTGVRRMHPELLWIVNGKDNRGKPVHLSKKFEGKLSTNGDDPKLFSAEDYRMGHFNLKRLTEALEAKAKQVPHPNPVARFFGK